ncbi:YiiX/YebB-like N1pC/P60 family cysteine hydrolase [Sulfurimonas sp.]
MKQISLSIIFIITLLFTACGSNSTDTKSAVEILNPSDDTLNPFQVYVEEMLSYRTFAFNLFGQVKDKDPLSGEDLDVMHHMTLHYLNTKDESEKYINQYQYLVKNNDDQYTPKERFELVMISLASDLIRYDDYILAYKNYEDNTKLREFLNDADSAYDIPANTLSDITNAYNSLTQREDIKDMIDFYQNNIQTYADEQDSFFLYLKALIEESPSYQLGFDDTADTTTSNLANLYNITVDTGDDALDLLLNEISKDFGNSAGLVATRKGKLYDDANVAANVRASIQPGDILLEKTPFRLTDKLIPGHWGDAAIYIGTEDELKALGLWDDPVVSKYHQEIIDGKVIDEALRDGVQLNTVEHFLNIDDLAIMHDENETLEDKKARIILTLRQLGKEYDFKFDIETSVKIVCSELIYATSILIDWATEKTAGINTISPDNVAVKSVEDNTTFTLKLLYHDGVEITTDRKAYMQGLLDGSTE